MIDITMTWDTVLLVAVGSIPGIILSRWLGFREGKKTAQDELAMPEEKTGPELTDAGLVAQRGGPYRTGRPAIDANGRIDLEAKPWAPWLYPPQTCCPRCGEERIILRGRFIGEHKYDLQSDDLVQRDVVCLGHPGEAHVHYQCWPCGADWAEIPPEEYSGGDDDEDD